MSDRDVMLVSEHRAKLKAAHNRADVQRDAAFVSGFYQGGAFAAILAAMAAFEAYLWLS